jgi:hypothetical protein
MLETVKNQVRYWGFLLVKFAAAGLVSSVFLWAMNLFWVPHTPWFHLNKWQFGFDLGYTTLAGVWFLFTYALLYLAWWDHKYRCHTCLRRLMMPVETGSWGYLLQLGRPKMEYICAYGHGTLDVEEIQFTGAVPPDWREHGDIWKELFAEAKGTDHTK